MHLELIDVAVILVYATLVLAMSQLVPRSKRGGDEDQEPVAAKRSLPWWAIGASLIAANISAEQIIGMSGSAYAFGLAVASYEWMAAFAMLLAGKYFLPIYLKNQISTMPEFLKRRYGSKTQVTLAVFWLGLYTFVALTAIMWLGATAVHAVTGLSLIMSIVLLALVAGNYALYVGLKPAAFTDVLQVAMLVVGGLVICFFAMEKISVAWGGGTGIGGLYFGFQTLLTQLPEHFHMILEPDNPFYKYSPGIAVLVGGMWVINISYWGFNQYIVQGALAAKSIRDAQKGVVLAAFLKLLMPVIVVVPGIAAALLLPGLGRSDEAYPQLMTVLPAGVLGFVFVALVAAIIASMGSTLASIAAIFTMDVFKVVYKPASKRLLMIVGRFAAIVALILAMATAMPLLDNFDQAFQYIQEYNGFFSPGIVVVFVLGLFWKQATERGALSAAIASVVLSTFFRVFLPQIPFMNRIGYVFLVCLALAIGVSLTDKSKPQSSTIVVSGVSFATSASYNIAAFVIAGILAALYIVAW